MARVARVVIPDYPHHLIQRGNRRLRVFFSDQDKTKYTEILIKHSQEKGIAIWAYCLMDNHIHLIAVPEKFDSFARGIGEAHKEYTRMINFREGWRGYLWQGRFLSYPLDEKYLYSAVRYVERNPVRAGLVIRAEEYEWSSARAHVRGIKDNLLSDNFLLTQIDNWAAYLEEDNRSENELFRKHRSSGRPLGDEEFISRLENLTGRVLRKKKTGPKKKKFGMCPQNKTVEIGPKNM